MSDSQHTELSPVKRALLELRALRARLDELEGRQNEPIAIIGAGLRFPGGAHDLESFWRLLRNGVDAITEVPPDRWDARAYYDPDPAAPGKMSTRYGGFITGIDQFDPQFFGISPREAASMDPQQRLLLEVAWEALENAGQPPDQLAGSRTGVFVGISNSDYLRLSLRDINRIDVYSTTGSALSVAGGRLSYVLGLQGPNISVDTACSASLVAVHLAVQSLRLRESSLALAGGVSVMLTPDLTVNFSKAQMLAADGRCKTFDAHADGYVRGEGCGLVVLKRLSEALADGDRILAVIRGSAINQDGRSGGLTAPNGPSQEQVIAAALANAGVRPEDVGYVEAHGTGTSLGDPIEAQALGAALGHGRRQPLLVGSVKTNFGHLEAAAGIAGLIKAALALHHGEIPPHLHFHQPSPYIPWAQLALAVPVERTPWRADSGRRIAGVSSFGFSGTNAHVVLEEAPAVEPAALVENPPYLLALSARNAAGLSALTGRYADYLAQHPEVALADVCYTASVGRAHLAHRLALVTESSQQAKAHLSALAAGELPPGAQRGQSRGAAQEITFLFTGHGAQYAQMGRRLYETQPVFREAVNQCADLLRPSLEHSLLAALYPEPGMSSLLDGMTYTQPALFAIQYGLAALWQSWGVRPAMVMGHSVGEYAAACIAGVFSLEDGLKLVAARGRLMDALPETGQMAAVFADERTAAEAVAPYADRAAVAVINGPQNVVISGAAAAVEAIIESLARQGIKSRRLAVAQASHSPLVNPLLDEFEMVAATVVYAAPQTALVSCATGQVVRPDEVTQPGYWRRHLRQPVRFSAAMETLYAAGQRVFVEIGPNPTLLALGRRCLPDDDSLLWLPSLREGVADMAQLLDSLGALYVQGCPVDWRGFAGDAPRRKLPLPTYPFQRARYWLDLPPTASPQPAAPQPPDIHGWFYQPVWDLKPLAAVSGETPARRWLILSDQGGVGDHLAALLAARGDASDRVAAAPDLQPGHFAPVLSAAPYHEIVYLWGLDADDGDQVDTGPVRGALYLIQALIQRGDAARLWLVTRGAQAVGGETGPAAVGQSLLWGLGRVMALEYPALWGGLIDLDPDAPDAAALLAEMWLPDGENQTAWRGGQRYVARLKPALTSSAPEMPVDGDATYLITGGLGGLGLKTAAWLASRGARHLALTGRRGASEAAQAEIRALEAAGVAVRVIRADVASPEQAAGMLDEIRRDLPPLRGIIHAAGALDDGTLALQTWERFEQVLAPKAAGAWNLHRLTYDLPLDFFVLFSSAAGLLGSPGQANYAAANTFLDALAHHRRALGLPALSINWSAWAQVGMAASLDSVQRRRVATQGLIAPEQGIQALAAVIGLDAPQVAVLSVDWSAVAGQMGGRVQPFLSRVVGSSPADGEQAASADFLARLRASTPEMRHGLLISHVQETVVRVLRLPRPPEPEQGLFEFGLDSLMALELSSRLQASLGQPLPATIALEHPTAQALADYLAGALRDESGEAVTGTNVPVDAAAAADLLSRLDKLSDEEVERLLRQMQSGQGNS